MSNTAPTLPATPLQRAFDVLAVIGVLSTVIPLAAYWSRLPESVPTHFGLDGTPDHFGGRGTFVAVAAVCVGLYLWTSLLARVMTRFRKPDKPMNSVAAQQGRTLMSMTRAFMTVVFAWTLWGAIQVSLGREDGLGAWLLPAVGVFLIILIVMSIRIKRSEVRAP